MPISLPAQSPFPVKLLVTQSVVMARISAVSRKSAARIFSTTLVRYRLRIEQCDIGLGELLSERLAEGFHAAAIGADLNHAGCAGDAGEFCGGRERDQEFIVFGAAGATMPSVCTVRIRAGWLNLAWRSDRSRDARRRGIRRFYSTLALDLPVSGEACSFIGNVAGYGYRAGSNVSSGNQKWRGFCALRLGGFGDFQEMVAPCSGTALMLAPYARNHCARAAPPCRRCQITLSQVRSYGKGAKAASRRCLR